MKVTREKLHELLRKHRIGKHRTSEILNDLERLETEEDIEKFKEESREPEGRQALTEEQKAKNTEELLISMGHKQPPKEDVNNETK